MTGVLRFESVTKDYATGALFQRAHGILRALDNVSFNIGREETVGLIGESGSGKSTIARIATGLLRPSSGSVMLLGNRMEDLSARQLRARRAEVGFVFQNPYESLNPRQRIADIVALPFRVHQRMTGVATRKQVHDLLDRVGLSPAGEFGRKLPYQLSGGQRQRVAVARAIALQPRLLIADEPVSALDVSISGQILNLLRDVQQEMGSSMLFISHDLSLAQAICDRILVLHRGRVVESGPTAGVLGRPVHPYSLQLLASMPLYMTTGEITIPREVLGEPVVTGCLFRDRCPFAMARCEQFPRPFEASPGHHALCWLLNEDPAPQVWLNLRMQIASRMTSQGRGSAAGATAVSAAASSSSMRSSTAGA